MRKIKSLSVAPCKHDYTCNINRPSIKRIALYAVITSDSVLHSVCEICGHSKAEIVTAGYLYLDKLAGGNGDG
jgi:hypothetical protein